MTSDRLLTRPSLTPKMTARSVPDRPPTRCQVSRRPTSAALVATLGDGHAIAARLADVGDLLARLQPVPDDRVLAFVGCDRGHLGRDALAFVDGLLVALEGLDELRHGRRPGHAGGQDDEPDAHPRPGGGRHDGTELAQLRRPDVGVATLVAGDPPERLGAARVLLDGGERVVQDDRVTFQLEVVETLLDVDRGHVVIVGHRLRVDSGRCLRPPERPSVISPQPTSSPRCPTSTSAWRWPNGP